MRSTCIIDHAMSSRGTPRCFQALVAACSSSRALPNLACEEQRHVQLSILRHKSPFALYPPLGVEAIREFQEFHSSENMFKSQKRVAKLQKTKNVRMRASTFVSNSISSYLIDLFLQVFNFPHLSIYREMFDS